MLQRFSLRALLQLWPLATFVLLVVGDCPRWTGRFRDCTCGVSYGDEEVRCCTADTCQEPQLFSHNRTCRPFLCQNGGQFNSQRRDCDCQPGFFGLCCERGELERCIAYLVIGWKRYWCGTRPTWAAKQMCNTNWLYCKLAHSYLTTAFPHKASTPSGSCEVLISCATFVIHSWFDVLCPSETEFCGGTLFAPSGVLSSPGYPNRYNNSLRCLWRISTDPIRRVALGNAGSMFEVEPGTTRHSCNHDWVAVYDGLSHRSPLIGRFCGTMMPTVRSSGRHMLVEFSTDWQQRRKGFQLHYLTFFAGAPPHNNNKCVCVERAKICIATD